MYKLSSKVPPFIVIVISLMDSYPVFMNKISFISRSRHLKQRVIYLEFSFSLLEVIYERKF